MARLETQTLSTTSNSKPLAHFSGQWFDQAHPYRKLTQLVLGRDNSVSETSGHPVAGTAASPSFCTAWRDLFLEGTTRRDRMVRAGSALVWMIRGC